MKQLYILLITFFITATSFGQTPIISAIVDGDCSGGTPKVLEVYAQGTVDFANYSIQNETNANTTWSSPTNLGALGVITDDFVYIVYDSDLTIFNEEFPSATAFFMPGVGAMSVNGDDRVRIIKDSDSSVVDQYGVESTDGTGTTWEYKDSYAKRKNNTGPDGGFTEANWDFAGVSALNGGGLCQSTTSFETMMGGIGTYTTSVAAITKNQIAGFAMYPNPVSNGKFVITSKDGANKQVEIYSMIGKQVYSKTVKANETINVSNLNQGIYLLRVKENDKIATRKLIVN